MSNSKNLWQVYQLAKDMRCRPSELLGITDTVQAFCFDRAAVIFGSALSHELENAKGKTDKAIRQSQQRIFNKWIPEATDSAGKRNAKGFRDPAKRVVV